MVCSSVWGNKKLKITDVEWTNDACFFNEINNVDEIDSTYNRWLYPREYAAGKEDRRRARQSAWIYHEPRDRNNRSSLIGICSCWCWKNLRIQCQPSGTLVPDKWTSCLRKPHPRVTIPIDSHNTNFRAEYTRWCSLKIVNILTPGYFLQTGPISLRLSKEQQAVVPKVVETKKGIYPSAVSASIAWRKLHDDEEETFNQNQHVCYITFAYITY